MSDAPDTPVAQDAEAAAPTPPATFEWLTLSLRLQAEMHLGLLGGGEDQEPPKPNLEAARHAIDLLAMLQEKTKGNLTWEEQRLLDNSVTELRFRYVQAFEESRKRQG
ncbi:MAG: DUF1844 domain-containing protein [Bryobacterales bacterium]|nr:DUF1844 domain-containing protein [Bryobacteraceae bacterium]MDW8354237.1 DUF1844 domain-containing protein [Bryobacterales bacterium]